LEFGPIAVLKIISLARFIDLRERQNESVIALKITNNQKQGVQPKFQKKVGQLDRLEKNRIFFTNQ
jgi:hypothetical protein